MENEKEIAAEVRGAVEALNAVVTRAHQAGLSVDVDTVLIPSFDDWAAHPRVRARIVKPI